MIIHIENKINEVFGLDIDDNFEITVPRFYIGN